VPYSNLEPIGPPLPSASPWMVFFECILSKFHRELTSGETTFADFLRLMSKLIKPSISVRIISLSAYQVLAIKLASFSYLKT